MLDERPSVLNLEELFRIAEWQHEIDWQPFREGIEIYRLYGDGMTGPTAALLRFAPGAQVALHEHTGFEHILVLDGFQVDENSRADAGTLIVNPPGSRHSVLSETGCIVLAIYEKPVVFVGEPVNPDDRPTSSCSSLLLAVNGTLMRGLELDGNLTSVGAAFVQDAATAPVYRLWSIGDRHPAMRRVLEGGVRVAVELWDVPTAGLASVLAREPAGLTIGKVILDDGREVLGVLGESWLCDGGQEITAFGGWRAYVASRRGPHAVGT